jgi:hypothetical protein
MAATTDVAEMFKYTYGLDKMQYLASQEVVMWNLLKPRMKEQGGRGQAIIPIQTKNSGVFRGHAEGGALTTRRAQPGTAEATFSLQEFHGIWDISWKMLRAATKSEWAFEKALDFMDSSMRRRVFRLINADLCGSGLGELAVLTAADNQATITVNSLPFADLGLHVDLVDVGDHDTLHADGVTVDAITIDSSGFTITCSGAASSTAALDYFTVADSVSSSASLHMNGMLGVINNANPASPVGNYGGINRSTAGNEYWSSTVFDNSGTNRPLTEDLAIHASDVGRMRGGVPIDRWVSNTAILRRYHEELSDRVFTSTNKLAGVTEAFDGKVGVGRPDMDQGESSKGDTPYNLNGKPWHCEPYFKANTMIGWADEHFWIAHDGIEVPTPLGDIFDGMVDHFKRTSNATFEVDHYWEADLVSDMPQAAIRINDVAES